MPPRFQSFDVLKKPYINEGPTAKDPKPSRADWTTFTVKLDHHNLFDTRTFKLVRIEPNIISSFRSVHYLHMSMITELLNRQILLQKRRSNLHLLGWHHRNFTILPQLWSDA